MYIVMRTGITTNGPDFQAGDVVDWPDEEAKRLIAKGFAEEASPEEVKAAGKKARKYTPPKKTERDVWPPKQQPASRIRDRGALAKEEV